MTQAEPPRLVVKVGTSTLTDPLGRLDRGFIADLTAQLAAQRLAGWDVILVTSGAIRAGREVLERRQTQSVPTASTAGAQAYGSNLQSLPFKQAAAAIGQGRLVYTYTEAFSWRNIDCAQVLITRDDLSDRRRFLNARNTLQTILALGVIPIINENDTVAIDEIKFGDNDHLAALVAMLVEAELLLILSDVEGLYDRPPSEPGASVIHDVPRIDASVVALAGGSVSSVGTGGMRTKIEAARMATNAGIRTVIAKGRRDRVIADVLDGLEVGTTFRVGTASRRLPARKRWIAHGARPRGAVTVNARAKSMLCASGVSLLAVGIVDVAGEFLNGDLVELRDEAGVAFARGLSNYAAGEIRRIQGLRSEQFEDALGYRGFDEVIHRDNLVIE